MAQRNSNPSSGTAEKVVLYTQSLMPIFGLSKGISCLRGLCASHGTMSWQMGTSFLKNTSHDNTFPILLVFLFFVVVVVFSLFQLRYLTTK